jgi:FixJ family two-component response regulator
MQKKATLLAVVDDDEDVRVALARLVSSAGFAVEAYASGAMFVQSLADHEPECVVLDLHMPGMSGFDVQGAMSLAHACVPVVVITGHHTPESCERALRLGAKAYLRKPVDDEALLSAIGTAIAATSSHP